jgi:predicted short-subunit dehydrogenase-like oxidoreductase (DUF2520 family)
MRELERLSQPSPAPVPTAYERVAIIGSGRAGTALAAALTAAGVTVDGPLGRGADAGGADVVLLCVPDAEIATAAQAVATGPAVGHCSGATGLDVLAPHRAFSLHPLMTFPADGPAPALAGAAAAIDGDGPHTLALARDLAQRLGLVPVALAAEDRAAYHAAASIASNFLVTLEGAAERLAVTAGVERAQLVPLVRATVENWARLGAERALTGPIARGDEATVSRQRAALADRTPELLDLFDTMAAVTRALARSSAGVR